MIDDFNYSNEKQKQKLTRKFLQRSAKEVDSVEVIFESMMVVAVGVV